MAEPHYSDKCQCRSCAAVRAQRPDPSDRPDEPMIGGPHEIEGQYRGEPSRDPRQ